VTYVGFAAAAGQVEIEGNPELPECLQVFPKTFPRKLPQCILIPLSSFLHLSFLRTKERKNTWRKGKKPVSEDHANLP